MKYEEVGQLLTQLGVRYNKVVEIRNGWQAELSSKVDLERVLGLPPLQVNGQAVSFVATRKRWTPDDIFA